MKSRSRNARLRRTATTPMPSSSTSASSGRAISSAIASRMINNDRNSFAASMVALGDADGMITGVTRNYSAALGDMRRVIDDKPGHSAIGVSLVLARGRTVLVADTAIHEMPTAQELVGIAIEAAGAARRLGYLPRGRAACVFHLRQPGSGDGRNVSAEAVKLLDQRRVEFEI